MNKSKLNREGQKWVEDKIITNEQLHQILARYTKKDPNFVIILFAILLTGLGFLTFIFSDWAQVPHFSRVIIVLVVTIGLYILGDILFRKRSTLLGVSFVILGYVVFGAGMFLIINIYNVTFLSAWPFLIWSIVGLLLYFIYEHRLLFVVGIIVTTAGQIYSGASFSSFDWLIFLVLLLGFAHFTYHRSNLLFGYVFGISFSLQMVVLTMAESQQYYWLVVYFLVLYIISNLIPKQSLKVSWQHISLLSIFIFGMYQSFLLQEEFFASKIEYQFSFLMIWFVLIAIGTWMKLTKEKSLELIDFVLFLPVFYMPFSYIIGLISLFVFSICWLIFGYLQENSEKILLGTIAFLLSTFTVYIQYAWDAMNKSLFFLIGGILLFLISFFFEKQRRSILEGRKGGTRK